MHQLLMINDAALCHLVQMGSESSLPFNNSSVNKITKIDMLIEHQRRWFYIIF